MKGQQWVGWMEWHTTPQSQRPQHCRLLLPMPAADELAPTWMAKMSASATSVFCPPLSCFMDMVSLPPKDTWADV